MDDSTETNEVTLFYLRRFFILAFIIFVRCLPPSENAANDHNIIMLIWLFFASAGPNQANPGQSIKGLSFGSGSVFSRRLLEMKRTKENSTRHE